MEVFCVTVEYEGVRPSDNYTSFTLWATLEGAGAFFTLKNLILFHDCGFPKMSQKMSREYLYELASQKDLEGYKLFGILKDFLVVNGINIEAMRAEWRK